jgi:tRNA(Ile)-lysidine synthase
VIITPVVTGHTLSDRAETLLYNLIRGSGADGLQALTWKRPLEISADTNNNLWLVRPMLEILRSQTGQFCQDQQLKIWEDSTNQDLNYARNRIRTELIPYQQAIVFEPNSTHLKINRLILRQAPLALQRRVMRRWLQEILPTSPTFEMIEKLTALIEAPNRSQSDPFPGGAIAKVDGEWIYTI